MSGRDLAGLSVSRETTERLNAYLDLLLKWTERINLVGRSTADDIWQRHFLDSAQLLTLAPEADTWLDLGSGGGFPGMVIAVLAKELRPALHLTLVDSDQRKCAFLRTVARDLDIACTLHCARIENLQPTSASIISARALADLPTLLALAHRHAHPDTTYLFPKGATWKNEVDNARKQWNFELEAITSQTQARSRILKINGVAHV